MRKFIQNKPFLASMILNLGLFLVFFTIFYSRYGTTDDVEMQMVLSGKGVLQDPSAYLRWTHIYIGYLLSTLYSYLPSIPWYGLYLSFAHLLGMTAILYSILILKTNLFRLSFFVLCFILGESALLQDLQFTSSALVLQTGAVFLLYTAISNPIDKRRNQWYIIAFIMLIFGSMMRWSTLELIVVLSTPLLLYAIFQQNKKRLFNVVFCVSILLTAYGLNKIHYSIQNQVKGWAIFNEYKALLTGPDILDYNKPQYKWTATTADDYFYKVGWEYEDLMLFKHWFFADSSVFGLKQFQALKNSFQNCPYPEEHIQERLWQFFIEMPLNDYVFYGFLVLGIVLMLIKGNRWSYLLIISSILLVIAILGSLFVYKHLPERVSYPIAFYLICLGALFITYDKEIQRNTKLCTLIAIGIMAISNLKMVTNESSKTAFAKMHWTNALDSLDTKPEQLYIGSGDYFMHAIMTPFQNTNDSMFLNFNMLDFGHLANTPTHYKQLKNFGIKNIHTEAPLDSNIYLIHRYQSPFLNWYANFVDRHYNMHIEYELIRKETKVDVAVYRIREQIRVKQNSQGINLENMHQFGIKKETTVDSVDFRADYNEEETFIFAD